LKKEESPYEGFLYVVYQNGPFQGDRPTPEQRSLESLNLLYHLGFGIVENKEY